MTGFGEAKSLIGDNEWHVVVQSVNSRYLDCRFRLPSALQSFEPKFRGIVKKFVERGKLDIGFTFSALDSLAGNELSGACFNAAFISGFCRAGVDLAESLAWPVGEQLQSTLLHAALNRREAFASPSENGDDIFDPLCKLFRDALQLHLDSCLKEGASLAQDFRSRISFLTERLAEIETLALTMPAIFKERIHQRLDKLLSEIRIELDESRLIQEIAYFIDKADISEEIVRLKAHLTQFIQELELHNVKRKGKKLEFLVQEMLREINTIGSKANLLDVTKNVVDMKNELEKIREQVQNVI